MLRYALYARKSKDDKSGIIKSIQDQTTIWRELAHAQNLCIKAEYEENKSAKGPGLRPVYQTMMTRIKRGEIDGILVWHVNRLARNMEEAGALAQMLIEGKIQEIRTPHWTYKPGDNILPLLLEQGMSTQYSLDLSEAVTRGMRSMVEAGGWPHQAKLGYLNARDPQNAKRGIILKDPERFDLTRRGFELMLTGGYTVRQAIDVMNSWGLQTRPTPTRPGGPLSYALGYDLFASPFYAGFTKSRGMVRQGTHPPMLTASEYHQLQAIVAERSRFHARGKGAKPVFAYTGMMRCGFCGLGITAERRFKSGQWRIYYHCSDPKGTCTKRGINEQDLETEILERLSRMTVDPALCELALENLARWQDGQSQSAEEILAGQSARLQALEQQRDRLLTMMLSGLLTDEATYKAKDAQLLRERNDLQMAIAKTLEDLEHIRTQARAGFGFVKSARESFLVADTQSKKEIARALGVEYVLRGRELQVSLDPLLREIVHYVDEIKGKLEPALKGSQSRYRPDFSASRSFGRGARVKLEPPAPPSETSAVWVVPSAGLMEALRDGCFPALRLDNERGLPVRANLCETHPPS